MNRITFDLSKVFEAQKKLDLALSTAHSYNEEKILVEKRLALAVEVCELTNEIKCFKYWSVNKKVDFNKIQQEFADVMHFVLSFGVIAKLEKRVFTIEVSHKMNNQELSSFILELIHDSTIFKIDSSLNNLIEKFLLLAYQIDITPEELEKNYLEKNKVNFERIANKY